MKEFPAKTMLLVTMCTYLSLSAEPPPPPPQGPFMGPPLGIIFPFPDPEGKEFEKLAQDLKLTKEKKDKIKSSLDKKENLLKEKVDKMSPLHEDLRSILESEKVDLTAVKSKLQEISNIQLDIRMIQIQGRLEFESQLNAEQKTTVKAMHKKRMDTMRSRREFISNPDRPECIVEPKK
ncbi:Spy/CpxP family protein refolding chaperone [Leptospira sp. 'Mane']|uniref:Spy/CpxP family protein refolding chaperone n=1 Tax=Leptospira sp. 'Mane' TaxID=3387407 RepID=UPI00398AD91D